MSLDHYREHLDAVRLVDWASPPAVRSAVQPLFDLAVDDKDFLRALLTNTEHDPHLQAMCERYDFMDKVVAFDSDEGVRIRFHLFRPGYFDRPHNHRWPFGSVVLAGEYVHTIFGTPELAATPDNELTVLSESLLAAGTGYVMSADATHSVVAKADTVSFVVRGPAVRDRFLILDRAAGHSFHVYGNQFESEQTSAAKRMDPQVLHEVIHKIRTLTHSEGHRKL
ncbi:MULTISPECIES: hypothetical protein [Nocardia]|uniref:hypothetical protein n=1 Tax=Nocardia TaxID=1817 RepID=UPI000BF23FB2|nr:MULTISPECIES: hypothetical protein [Nocardia]MBF6187045.1 hypothetical protein [Nocardia farcinica]MBF6312692.1 hypothetical protein [Nocardia farcinica]MBF6408453.1 hypothetical protein [Nocardia farcinica]PEH78913.1 hypothetical protein CRM89_25495 [Nocardia sp. FDAARGOS_372]UEX23538.1 hypothetical protein LMJ57_03280 [Nocardia farcinica]